MTASLGVFQDADHELTTFDGYGLTARVTGLPLDRDEGRRLIHLGAAATFRLRAEDMLRFRSRPESAQAQVLADTGSFDADRDLRFSTEAAAVLGSFSVQSEYIFVEARRITTGDDPFFQSAYAMASYVLTGESRSYRRQVGAFGAVNPHRSFPDKGPGAWEVLTRYSWLDLDSGGIDGGVLHDVSAGVNWYVNDNVRFMFNYIAAHPEGFGYEHIFQGRMQVSF